MDIHFLFLTLGALLLVALALDEISRRAGLPRVTLLILFGIAIGPFALDLLPAAFHDWYEFLASAALMMVAFLLGGSLTPTVLRRHGKAILVVSAVVVVGTAVIVGAGLILLGAPIVLALLLAGIAPATDPAATQDVVRQTGAGGPFTDTLLGIVAVDDAWGLMAFSVLLVAAQVTFGNGGLAVLAQGAWEIGGALAVGAAVGVPAAYLTGRVRPGEPIQAEALGVVFLCGGLALWLGVSFLLAGMTTGAVIANLAKHHKRAFHEIEHVEWPFMVLFFVLAGATLHLDSLKGLGLIGAGYIVLRIAGRILGGWAGGAAAKMPRQHRQWVGFALVPQAGVALGMALVAGNYFPELAATLLAVTVSTTVVFELGGPLLTTLALRKVGESHARGRT